MAYKIVAKYIKDLSFEIQDAKSYFLLEKNIKDFIINFEIKSKKLKESIIEVDTTLYLLSKKDNKSSLVSICLSSVVNLEKKFEKEELQKIILIEVPQTIYPEIRSTLIYLFDKCGFKKVNFEQEVDFKKLYESKKN